MNLHKLMENVLYEGGAAGHMMHPYDKFKTPEDLLAFFERFLSGEIEGTEKVDGYNLFAGFNESGKAVAVRNKNEEPMENINKKFGLNHPAYNAFTAGWTAVKQKLESLSPADRIKFNLKDNFINMEILYGYIPNVIPYSQTTNFIVFHHYIGTPENRWSPKNVAGENLKLNQLANKLGTIKVTTPNVTFTGDPDEVKRNVKDLVSEWEFKGPIEITKNDVKKRLDKIVSGWRSYSEVQALIKFNETEKKIDLTKLSVEDLAKHEEKKLELMKAVTKKLGASVLSNMVSKLSDTGEVVPGYPGIEGIVTRQGGDLVKITGDFLDYSKPEDVPVLAGTKKLREFVQKDLFGLTTSTLRGIKNKKQLYDYVMSNKKKKYTYILDDNLTDKSKIVSVIRSSKKEINDIIKTIQNKGRAFEVKNLLIQSFMLSNIEQRLEKVKSYKDLLDVYGEELYNVD